MKETIRQFKFSASEKQKLYFYSKKVKNMSIVCVQYFTHLECGRNSTAHRNQFSPSIERGIKLNTNLD